SDSMKSYCERIAKMGFVAYSFDFCGGSTESRSDGKPSDMTVFSEVEDLKAVLQMIKNLDFVDKQNIFLFGTSQGGLVSALTAAEFPTEIKGLLLFYPAFNIPDSVQKYAKVMPQGSLSPYITTLLDYDVYEHIKPYKGDVLIVHGTTDFVVPYTYSEKAAEVYENCELHLIPGGTHGFNADNYVSFGDFDRKTWDYAESFLKEHS
ncbi:MAG: alpha/beta hydrolase, partial [Acutalibacteraceae bacterium]